MLYHVNPHLPLVNHVLPRSTTLAYIYSKLAMLFPFRVPFAVCIFGVFGEIALAAVTTKNTGCQIDQQIQR